MLYTLYSFPNCSKCEKVKGYLKEKEIKYQEINAGLGEGRINFRDFYFKNKDKIEREKDGAVSLPILLKEGEIIQGLEKIIASLN
jgi:glutaredoxin